MGNDVAARLRLRKRAKKLIKSSKRKSTIDHDIQEVGNELENKVTAAQKPGGLRGSGDAAAAPTNHVTYPPGYRLSIGSTAAGGAAAGTGAAVRGSIGALNASSGAVHRVSTAGRGSIGGGSTGGGKGGKSMSMSVGAAGEQIVDIWQRPSEHQNPFSVSTYQINDADAAVMSVSRSESESELRRRAWALQRGSYLGPDGSHLSPIYRYPSAQPMGHLQQQKLLMQHPSPLKTDWSFSANWNQKAQRDDRRASLGFARKSASGEIRVPSTKRSRTKSPSPGGAVISCPRQPLQARSAIVDEPRLRIPEPTPAFIDEEEDSAPAPSNRQSSKAQGPSGTRAKPPVGPTKRSSLALDSSVNPSAPPAPPAQPPQSRPVLLPRSPLITSSSERRQSTTLARDSNNGNSLLRVECSAIPNLVERRCSSASFVLAVPGPTIPPPIDSYTAAPSTGDEDSVLNHYDTQL